VRWEESVRALAAMGVTQAWELGPGTVLTGLCKRIAPEVKAAAAAEPAQVRALAG
jgi:[acyl-carrier-protein] S-malonyltransferase